jgi:uncharacterized protein
MQINKSVLTKKVMLGLGVAVGAAGVLARRRCWPETLQPFPRADLAGRFGIALITGACSGIGAAFAHQLASQGYDLVLVARREDRLRDIATELEKRYPISAEVLVADLANPAGIERVEKRIGELDNLALLINNAGFGLSGKFADSNSDRQLEMVQVHVIASVRLCRAALLGMIARRNGGVINVSSISAFTPYGSSVLYNSTKAFLVSFSEALHVELKGTGVRVQALCPGLTHTEFHSHLDISQGHDVSQIPEFLWSSADEVVTTSLECLRRGQVVCIPGFYNRIGVALLRCCPTAGLIRALAQARETN